MTTPKRDKEAWEKWNREFTPVKLTPEQTLIWLDQVRAFMFEVWEKNPKLRKTYERLKKGD